MNSTSRVVTDILSGKPLTELERDLMAPELSTSEESGQCSMMAASESGRLEVLEFLVDRGVSFNIVDASGLTPLHLACQGGHLGVVRYLLEKGISVDVLTTQDVSPLMVAAAWDYPEVIDLLLQRGANPDLRDVLGQTALDIAVDKNSTGALSVLSALDLRGRKY